MLTLYNLDHPASLVKSTVAINSLFHNVIELKYFLNIDRNSTPDQRLQAITSRYPDVTNLSILTDYRRFNLAAFDQVIGPCHRHLRRICEVV